MRDAEALPERLAALALIACAFACGGRVAGDSQQTQPSYGAPRDYPPYAAALPRGGSGRPQVAPAVPPPPGVGQPPQMMRPLPNPPPSPLPIIDEYPDLARAAAENVLLANCGQCHGPALTADQASGRINFIGDLDQLTEAGLIFPLNSDGSRLIKVIKDGSMPPVASGLPPMTDADLAVVTQYIDNPRFWPNVIPHVPDAGAPPPVTPPPAAVDAGSTPPPDAIDAGAASASD